LRKQRKTLGGYFILPHPVEAIQRWSAICRVWPWTLTYQKFLLHVSSQGQALYSHQKLNMYIYWLQTPTMTSPITPNATVQPTRATYRQLQLKESRE